MNSSSPNDNKAEKASQPTNNDAQPATAAASSSDSDSSKGQPGPSNQPVVAVPPQQAAFPTWSTGLFECFDDIPTRVGWRNQTPEIQQTGGVMVPPKVPGGMNR
ncbi:hypothetical protein SSX86_020777 [Deinandra increscens subsp. villosa]|uniref:Uncharacterized protein n=1 Tax=Deinandra increscens subsp. villosa TaxID=3103831 RepID=A0AAP0GR42_9ASTR